MPNITLSEEKVIMNMINLSVILLGTVGIILNGFSLFVLWKCMTTGQLGIKLVLFSDLVVCVVYVISNVQHNIANSITLSLTTIMLLVTINRLTIQIALFVSNWWIIAILLLRTLTILLPKYVNLWNKMLYHKWVYVFCWICAIVIIVSLRFHERYVRVTIYILPVVLVSLEAGLIIYLIRKMKCPKLSPNNNNNNNNTQKSNCRDTASSSSSNVYVKVQPINHQSQIKYPKPYNNLVLTILTLALNYLILDCLQFIDALYHLCKFGKEPLPLWFMLFINIFSLLKRIFNFLILCVKCRYFRKIMVLKINIICRRLHPQYHCENGNLAKFVPKNNDKYPEKEMDNYFPCQKIGFYSKKRRLFSESHVIEKFMENVLPLRPNDHKHDNYVIDSYYSAFEVVPFVSRNSYPSNKHVLSTRY